MTTRDGDKEAFLSRWSRLKQETKEPPPQKVAERGADPEAPRPALPPLDQLTPDSDYRAFFHPKVGEDLRRAALKKLFSAPHFNIMDGLDVYIDDYSKSDPIPAAMLAQLRQAQQIIAWATEDKKEPGVAGDGRRPGALAATAPPALEDRIEPVLRTAVPDERPAERRLDAPGEASKT